MQSEFKHRRQDLPHMLQAVGGSKPWVSRSLRPWGVSIRSDGINFVWGGRERRCPISKRRHYPRPKVEFRGGSAVRMTLSKFGRVFKSPSVIVGREWTTFHDEESSTFDLVIPTKLMIEGLRLLDHWARDSRWDWHCSRRDWHCKTDRRLWSKKHKKMDRKRFVKAQGSHLRWIMEARYPKTDPMQLASPG